jgi:hypothetical protein
MVDMQIGRSIVYINRYIDPSLAEENVAHELMHTIIMDLGFVYPAVRARTEEPWHLVAQAMISWTTDILIDGKLTEFGYTNDAYHEIVYEGTRDSLMNDPQESTNKIDQICNALGYFYCHHSLDQEQWTGLKALYFKGDHPVFLLGEEIIQIGKETGFHDPTAYREFLLRLRQHFSLENVIDIIDPLTNQVIER